MEKIDLALVVELNWPPLWEMAPVLGPAPDLSPTNIKKKYNKNCMILHCKNAEMTIILSFLHFYSVKSYNFCYFFFSDPNMFQIK